MLRDVYIYYGTSFIRVESFCFILSSWKKFWLNRGWNDDVVVFKMRQNRLIGEAPQNIKGLLEIRNVGISRYDFVNEAEVGLLVNLVSSKENLERLPKNKTENILGVEIPAIDLYAEDTTILEKIIVKLRDNLLKTE